MKIQNIIKSPIFWLSTCIIIGLIIYFIFRKSKPDNKLTCKPTEEIINGVCVTKCLDTLVRCKDGSCYDPNTEYCDKNGITCNKKSHCLNSDVCCPTGQKCEESTNTCKACDIDCNGVCCLTGEKCAVNGTKCCDPDHIGNDSAGNEVCCTEKLCGKICCITNLEECIEGNCVQKCSENHIRCKNGDCYDPKNQYCDKNGIICNNISHCPNSDVCCPVGQQCEEASNTCKVCNIHCNGVCCNIGQKCAVNGTKCCDPDYIGKDMYNNEICCSQKLCGQICCIPNVEECINGNCVQKCEENKIRCKFGDCYDPTTEYCDKNGVTCNIIAHCPNSDTCCPQGLECEEASNTCKLCDIRCDKKCCNTGQKCAVNGTICCNIKNIGKDTKGNETCCENDLCNGVCCDEGIGEVCINGKCQIGCPNIRQLNSGLYTRCNDKDISFTGLPSECNYDTQVCLHNCNDNSFRCIDKTACWKNTTYSPNLLLYDRDTTYDYTLTSGQYKGQKTKVPVCQANQIDPNNINNLWISKGPSNLVRNVSVESGNTNLQSCNLDTCISKIIEPTSGIINYDKQQDIKNPTIANNICNSMLSCDNSLLDAEEMDNLCSIFDKDKITQGRCCKKNDNSGYTGQICPQNHICAPTANNNECILGWKCNTPLPNNRGTYCEPTNDGSLSDISKINLGYTCKLGLDPNRNCCAYIDVNSITQAQLMSYLDSIAISFTNNNQFSFSKLMDIIVDNQKYVIILPIFHDNTKYFNNFHALNYWTTNNLSMEPRGFPYFLAMNYQANIVNTQFGNGQGSKYKMQFGYTTGNDNSCYIVTNDNDASLDYSDPSHPPHLGPNSKFFENIVIKNTSGGTTYVSVILIGGSEDIVPISDIYPSCK